MKPVVWTNEAEATCERLIAYLIHHNSKQELEKVVSELERCIRLISQNPGLFALYQYSNRGARKCVITKRCVMFYRDNDEFIEILGIYDTRQDLSRFDL